MLDLTGKIVLFVLSPLCFIIGAFYVVKLSDPPVDPKYVNPFSFFMGTLGTAFGGFGTVVAIKYLITGSFF